MGNRVGYAHLIDSLDLKAIEVKRPALIQPVTRLEKIGGALSVPLSVAPAKEDYLAHIMFALKHEGVNLAMSASRLQKIISSRCRTARSPTPLIVQQHSDTNKTT